MIRWGAIGGALLVTAVAAVLAAGAFGGMTHRCFGGVPGAGADCFDAKLVFLTAAPLAALALFAARRLYRGRAR